MITTIKIQKETRDKLMRYKYLMECKTMDEVIDRILKIEDAKKESAIKPKGVNNSE